MAPPGSRVVRRTRCPSPPLAAMGSALLPSGGFHLEGAAVPYVPYSRSGGEDREDEGGMDVGAGMPEHINVF